MSRPVLRFAPSPNGRLHLGHAYSALLNAWFARAWGGRFLLRLEDIDLARCRPALVDAVLTDLAWLGLRWEAPVRRQSEHFDDYARAFARLREADLVYPCFCTRGRIAAAVEARPDRPAPRDPEGQPLYPGLCRGLPAGVAAARVAAGEPHAWRLDVTAALARCAGPHAYTRFDREGRILRVAADPARWGDVVLVRKEIPTSYSLAVVVDDALQGVTHVVRGQDLEAATDLHVLLQALLGLPTPLYHHHGLISDEAGRKLSKSLGSRSLDDLRRAGLRPGAVRAALDPAFGPLADRPGSADAEDPQPEEGRDDGGHA